MTIVTKVFFLLMIVNGNPSTYASEGKPKTFPNLKACEEVRDDFREAAKEIKNEDVVIKFECSKARPAGGAWGIKGP